MFSSKAPAAVTISNSESPFTPALCLLKAFGSCLGWCCTAWPGSQRGPGNTRLSSTRFIRAYEVPRAGLSNKQACFVLAPCKQSTEQTLYVPCRRTTRPQRPFLLTKQWSCARQEMNVTFTGSQRLADGRVRCTSGFQCCRRVWRALALDHIS